MKLMTSFLPVFLVSLIALDSVSAQEICFNGFFKPNSTYDLNRRQILSSLASNVTSNNGFVNSSIGQNPNRVFIIGMCIPGTKPETCSDCIKGASDRLSKSCPNQTEAYTWPDCCMVRYSNISFSGSLVMEPSESLYNTGDIGDTDANMSVFDRVYEELMVRTIAAALNGSSSFEQKYFAAEVAPLTTTKTIYAMMQCTPDVSSRDCELCLKKSVGEYLSCCRGKQGGAIIRPSCFFRWDLYPYAGAFDNVTLPPAHPPALPPPLPSLSPPVSDPANTTRKDGKTISTGIIVAIVVPAVIMLVLLVIGFMVCRKRKLYQTNEIQAGDEITTTRSLQFSFKMIKDATDKFADSNLIGRGGFGEVYKGILSTGTEVAVKRLSKSSGQGAQEFKNEAVLVTKLQHRNLVRLLGFCLEGEEKILVYEFVPNKSLDYFLFEYAMRGHFSMKSDVYSFGILILEVISGKKISSFNQIGDSAGNLVAHAWRLWRNGSTLKLIDPTIGESYQSSEATRCIHIALLCIQEDPADRPLLPAIIVMLTSSTTTLPVPRAPGFCLPSRHELDADGLESSQSTSRSITGSINDASITDFYPR
ncbi:hypothetical protein Bca101_019806 [Brassica carinata]